MQKQIVSSEATKVNCSSSSSKIGVSNNSFQNETNISETCCCDDDKINENNSPVKNGRSEENKQNDTSNNNNNNNNSNKKMQNNDDLLYTLNSIPPWYTTLCCSFQVCLIAINLFAFPLFLAPKLCVPNDDEGNVAKSNLVGTMFFVIGITTTLQTVLGVRLPILQGLSGAHIPSTFALLALPHNRCSPPLPQGFMNSSVTLYNDTDGTIVDGTELWQRRLREVQGAIALSSVVEVLIGAFGLVGFLLKYVGPVAVVPTILLSILPLTKLTSDFAEGQWGVTLLVFVVITLCSQYLMNTSVPLPYYSRRRRNWQVARLPLFKMFSILIALIVSYVLCVALTYTNVIPNDQSHHGYKARTDIRGSVIKSTPWFRFPYPGQWGLPTISIAGFAAMVSAVIASIIDSIGDYYACARACGAPPPPAHAVNRGIMIEGVGCILAGLLGNGASSTSSLTGVAAINITRVGSRIVLIGAGVIFTIFGVMPKIGSLFVTIPDPIVGGLLMVTFGTVIGVALQSLSYVDLNSKRNVFIIGSSVFLSLTVSQWSENNPRTVQTGFPILNQVITVLLQSSVFLGSSLAIFFDNTIPGTREERGIDAWVGTRDDAEGTEFTGKDVSESYNLPFPTKCLGVVNKIVPVFPGYKSAIEKATIKERVTFIEETSTYF